MRVEPATAADEVAWRTLWAGYLAFYRQDLPEAVTAVTWARILDPASPVHALVARDVDGTVVGFVVCVLHDTTWSASRRCYLEDLFVAPAARRKGVGRALVEAVLARARDQGWHDVYWHTSASNAVARRVYDAVAGSADGYVRYRVSGAG
jgi:GNAT superfamily N-acetyltransferase